MLHIVTGAPGAGKTLHTIQLVEKLRLDSNREVYYYNIPDLNLPWKLLDDPLSWHTLPEGSIYVEDEAQNTYRVRSKNAAVPLHVSEYETHRHRGLDVFLLTQHPQFLDPHIRKLCGKHFHLKRLFGGQMATVYEWLNRCVDPLSRHEYADARSKKWKYPKEFFGRYKSADVHNVKPDLPLRQLFWIGGILVAVVLLFVWVFGGLKHLGGVDPVPRPMSSPDVRPVGPRARPVQTHWDMADRRPRIPGIPSSAPLFDAIQVVRSAPRLTGCMSLKIGTVERCECTSQQGTVLDISYHQCRRYMKRWPFDETLPDRRPELMERRSQGAERPFVQPSPKPD